jgi:glycosyltransferase involved in cell wall biosynthesis
VFTVIIATHDRPQLLQRTLMSLAFQTYQDFKTIIVSDSANYVAPYEALNALKCQYLYLLRNGAPGPAESRNLGIKLVDTDYAMFLDDDDTLEPNHLELMAKAINASEVEGSTIFYCDFKIIEEDRTAYPPKFLKSTVRQFPGITRESVYVQNLIPNSCLIYPRQVLQSCQYDSSLILFEDWEYLVACLDQADLCYLPIDSVCIHKSYVAGEANIRRGNVNDELLVPTTLEIYRKHSSPDDVTRQQRLERFSQLGVQLSEEYL